VPPSKPDGPATFGAAFTALLAAAGLTPDKVLVGLKDRRWLVSRSALYDWRKGAHLPEDTGPLLAVVGLCLRVARDRGASLDNLPCDEGGWLTLLAAAKQARDSDIAQGRATGGGRPPSTYHGKPVEGWDPVNLGVHQAIGGGRLPKYVRRHHDNLLNAVLDPTVSANRLVVLRGASSTGKSRAAYQAVMNQLPHWRIDYPRTATALAQRLFEGIRRRTVVWLGELRHYAEADRGDTALGGLADLLTRQGEVVVITTLWHEHWTAYTASNRGGPGVPDPAAVTREILTSLPDLTLRNPAAVDPSRGGVIDIPARFSKDDVARALKHGDPALDEAIAAARAAGCEGEITQYLAGVPDLLDHYQAPGGNPYGQAVIRAAMDAARLGHFAPCSPKLMQDAIVGYLTDRQRTIHTTDWWEQALVYATEELKGAVRALDPVPPEHGTGVAGYKLADYLDQRGRLTHQACLGPASLWDSLAVNTTGVGDLHRLGNSAHARGFYRHAAQLWTRASAAGNPSSAAKLIALLQLIDRDGAYRLSHWAVKSVTLDDASGVADLFQVLREAGVGEAVKVLLARRPADRATIELHAYRLLSELNKARAKRAATTLATRAANQLTLESPAGIAVWMRTMRESGAVSAVVTLATRAADGVVLDHPSQIGHLLFVMRDSGCEEAAAALAMRAAGQFSVDSPDHVHQMLGALCESKDAVTTLAARAADHVVLDDPTRVAQMLDALHDVEAKDVIVALATRAANGVALVNSESISFLLSVLRRAGVREAATALAGRVAKHIAVEDARTVRGLLMDMGGRGAGEAFTVLAARAAGKVSLDEPFDLVSLLREMSRAEDKSALAILAERIADHVVLDNLYGICWLVEVLCEVEGVEAAARLATRAAMQAPINESTWSLTLLLRQISGAPDLALTLARRVAAEASLDNPGRIAQLLEGLREADAREATLTLANRAAIGVEVNDPWGIAQLLEGLREADAREATLTLANRAAIGVEVNDPWGIAWLTLVMREARAMDAVSVLVARDPNGHLNLDDPQSITSILHALRVAGAGQIVVGLLEPRNHPMDITRFEMVAKMLQELPKEQAPRAVASLAAQAAERLAIDFITLRGRIGKLLIALRDVGAGEAADAVALKAAERIPLDYDDAVGRRRWPEMGRNIQVTMLQADLRDANALDAIKALAIRAADRISFDSTAVADVLHDLRDAGADDAATALISQLANAGRFEIFLQEMPGARNEFAFGRDPHGSASLPWKWHNLVDWSVDLDP
jgi:hypothetical protein